MRIPQEGKSKAEIMAALHAYKANDLDWQAGKVFAYTYDPGDEPREVVKEAYGMYLTENALDPTAVPSLLKLETDVVRATITLLGGDENVVGNMSSGGTESIMLAVKTARDHARAEKGITAPQMIVSSTAHGAFHKAAHYLGVELITQPCRPGTFDIDINAMADAITDDTILLVVSAPNYSHGIVEQVEEVAALAQKHDLLCHVDACIGGFFLAVMRENGYAVPPFDWRVPGVTSISCDLHKFGYAAKGASVIMYRDKALRRYQIWANLSTTAYTLINATVQSTRSGGPMAGAWAALHTLGMEGYGEIVTAIMDATDRVKAAIGESDELRLLGEPDMCLLAFTSDAFNIYMLADEMKKRGWYIQPQFSTETTPRNLHMTMQYTVTDKIDAFVADLRACVAICREKPAPDEDLLQQMIAPIVAQPTMQLMNQAAEQLGLSAGSLPEEMATINTVLDLIPTPLAEAFLVGFFNDLYV